MQRLTASFVLGYHGCEKAVAEDLLAGVPFVLSSNDYDWLGEGAYFWEADPIRGYRWAEEQVARKRFVEASVVGVVLDLGLCLDLTTQKSLSVIRTAYDDFKLMMTEEGLALPQNRDALRRDLDCQVLNYLYEMMPEPRYQTVRAPFVEGVPLYEGSHIPAKTHIQIAVRDLACIKGVFRVAADQLA